MVLGSSRSLHYYVENYYRRMGIYLTKGRVETEGDLKHDYMKLLCRKIFTDKELAADKEDKEGVSKENKEYTKINHETTTNNIKILNAIKFATLTATYLDWCICARLQTDSMITFVGNQWMRMSNGNGKVKDTLDILYQNIPGTLGAEEVGTVLDTLISRLEPDVLFLGEVDSTLTKATCPDGYEWVGGNLKGETEKIRMSAIVKNGLIYKKMKFTSKVPTVTLHINDWRLLGVYREWSFKGDRGTKTKELQTERFEDFTCKWKNIKTKSIVLGDFNFTLCRCLTIKKVLIV